KGHYDRREGNNKNDLLDIDLSNAYTEPGSKSLEPIVYKKLIKEDQNVRLSKFISYILRHGARKEGITIRSDGYARLDELMKLSQFESISLGKIKNIIKNDAKQRFNLIKEVDHNTGTAMWWVRANQGHSFEVKDLKLENITDPAQISNIFHETHSRNWQSIKSKGLLRMYRNHIHFCGAGNAVSDLFPNSIYYQTDGIEFYKAANNVILTTGRGGVLHPRFFLKVVDKTGKVLYSAEPQGD
ncbi:5320_t:CDS:2, partial [Paraglomus brasilianum]